jgi:hypothetical protein
VNTTTNNGLSIINVQPFRIVIKTKEVVYLAEMSNVNHLFSLKLALGVTVPSAVSHQHGLPLNASLCPCVGNDKIRFNFRGSTILKAVINY